MMSSEGTGYCFLMYSFVSMTCFCLNLSQQQPLLECEIAESSTFSGQSTFERLR
jgi:hypothetical protein